ncbi:hypothetical protein CASFOL_033836 [Castilleja foliolosa]|uniref:E3 ubiquitin-protein ligase RMA n=1 Tax=Castilleja foliolosa TaxID=1961234 RepID=A0ABD3BY39_9LAMI
MDDNNSMNVNRADIDLNQVPIDPHPFHDISYESLLLDRAQELVEERIRQLEGVTARERQRQDRNAVEITTVDGVNNNTVEVGKGCKGDGSHLVAKALEIDSGSKNPVIETQSFYHCIICFDVAIEPVLTCCGHLYCWACFYQVPSTELNTKECPMCKGEVAENAVFPIYGNSGGERVDETEWGVKIPPRPKARRVESIRQRFAAAGVHNNSVEEVLRHMMISIEANPRAAGGSRVRVNQVPRILLESGASLATLSSALVSAKRLVEELEMVINSRLSADEPQASGSDARARRTSRNISMWMDNPNRVRETRVSRRRRLN